MLFHNDNEKYNGIMIEKYNIYIWRMILTMTDNHLILILVMVMTL